MASPGPQLVAKGRAGCLHEAPSSQKRTTATFFLGRKISSLTSVAAETLEMTAMKVTKAMPEVTVTSESKETTALKAQTVTPEVKETTARKALKVRPEMTAMRETPESKVMTARMAMTATMSMIAPPEKKAMAWTTKTKTVTAETKSSKIRVGWCRSPRTRRCWPQVPEKKFSLITG